MDSFWGPGKPQNTPMPLIHLIILSPLPLFLFLLTCFLLVGFLLLHPPLLNPHYFLHFLLLSQKLSFSRIFSSPPPLSPLVFRFLLFPFLRFLVLFTFSASSFPL